MKKINAPTITAKKLFLKIAAAESPLVFLRGKGPACEDVSEWLIHVCIEAEDHGIDAHTQPVIITDLDEMKEFAGDLESSDLLIAAPAKRTDDPSAYIKLARAHDRDVIVVDVGYAGEKLADVEHIALVEEIMDEDWYTVAAEVEKASHVSA